MQCILHVFACFAHLFAKCLTARMCSHEPAPCLAFSYFSLKSVRVLCSKLYAPHPLPGCLFAVVEAAATSRRNLCGNCFFKRFTFIFSTQVKWVWRCLCRCLVLCLPLRVSVNLLAIIANGSNNKQTIITEAHGNNDNNAKDFSSTTYNGIFMTSSICLRRGVCNENASRLLAFRLPFILPRPNILP